MMSRVISEYFVKSARDTRSRMDGIYKPEIEEFSRLINSIITPLSKFDAARPRRDDEVPYHSAFGLMTKGANTLAAAFELALSGYLWEPSGLLRVALETYAVAWDIVNNPERFAKWKADKKFESTRSISNAKEVTEVIGRLYGMLSDMNVHINQRNSSPAMVQADVPKFQLFGLVQPGKESIRRPEVYLSLFVTFICLRLTELTFHKHCEKLETIEIVAGGAKSRISETHKGFVEEMMNVFRDMAEGRIL